MFIQLAPIEFLYHWQISVDPSELNGETEHTLSLLVGPVGSILLSLVSL